MKICCSIIIIIGVCFVCRFVNGSGNSPPSAPTDTRVVGDLIVKEDEMMKISCKFTQSTTPPVSHRVVFSFDNGTAIESSVNQSYMATVTMEDDGRAIRCHPFVEMSQILSNRGESPPRKIRVLFSPKKIDKEKHRYNWSVGSENSWEFTFKSRPLADKVILFSIKNDSMSEVNFRYSNSSIGDLQTIAITAIQLPKPRDRNPQDDEVISQQLMLAVYSSAFPTKHIAYSFDLDIVGYNRVELRQRKLLLIYTGSAVAGFILVFVLVWKFLRCQSKKARAEADTDGKDDDTIYSTVDDEKGGFAKENRLYVNYNGDAEDDAGSPSTEQRVYKVTYNAAEFGTDKINPVYETD